MSDTSSEQSETTLDAETAYSIVSERVSTILGSDNPYEILAAIDDLKTNYPEFAAQRGRFMRSTYDELDGRTFQIFDYCRPIDLCNAIGPIMQQVIEQVSRFPLGDPGGVYNMQAFAKREEALEALDQKNLRQGEKEIVRQLPPETNYDRLVQHMRQASQAELGLLLTVARRRYPHFRDRLVDTVDAEQKEIKGTLRDVLTIRLSELEAERGSQQGVTFAA